MLFLLLLKCCLLAFNMGRDRCSTLLFIFSWLQYNALGINNKVLITKNLSVSRFLLLIFSLITIQVSFKSWLKSINSRLKFIWKTNSRLNLCFWNRLLGLQAFFFDLINSSQIGCGVNIIFWLFVGAVHLFNCLAKVGYVFIRLQKNFELPGGFLEEVSAFID